MEVGEVESGVDVAIAETEVAFGYDFLGLGEDAVVVTVGRFDCRGVDEKDVEGGGLGETVGKSEKGDEERKKGFLSSEGSHCGSG